MQNVCFVYELNVFNTLKLLSIVFKHRLVFAWVIDDPMGQSYFIDYRKISFVIFSYAFNQNSFIHLLP